MVRIFFLSELNFILEHGPLKTLLAKYLKKSILDTIRLFLYALFQTLAFFWPHSTYDRCFSILGIFDFKNIVVRVHIHFYIN